MQTATITLEKFIIIHTLRSNPTLGEMKTYVHTKSFYAIAYSNFIQNYQKLEATEMSFYWLMNEQTVVHPYNGILFNNKRNGLLSPETTWVNHQSITLSKKKSRLKRIRTM